MDPSHPSDLSDMEEALNDPPPLVEVEGVEEQQKEEKKREKRDSAFIWDMGLKRSRRLRRTLMASSRTLTTRTPEGGSRG